MTVQDIKEFINQVKGKKIKSSNWSEGEYFIPNGEWIREYGPDYFFGDYYIDYKLVQTNDQWRVGKGFNTEFGWSWEFVNEEINEVNEDLALDMFVDLVKLGILK